MTHPPLSTPNYKTLADESLSRCDQIALCTETEGQITRRFLTPPMRSVHQQLTEWMQTAGMQVHVDHAGNLIAKRAAANNEQDSLEREQSPVLLIGSHLDTVPNAGRYDGILGVIAGLAVIEALGNRLLPFDIDVIGFSEEEGVRFATPYIGSEAVAGTFKTEWLDRIDEEGQTLRSVIEAYGLLPDQIAQASYDANRVIGFIEPHIEQGPWLNSVDHPVGLVAAIAGQTRLAGVFEGKAGHAGTTPMTMRCDALVSAARWIAEVSDYANRMEGLRATVGYVNVRPNVRNVIPGRVDVSADIRHADDKIRLEATRQLCNRAELLSVEHGVAFKLLEQQSQSATAMNTGLMNVLSEAIDESGFPSTSMLSGAGHDAVVMAKRFPTAMLFIRQPSGISHHPDEDVQRSDVAIAIEVLTRFVDRMAQQFSNHEVRN